MVKGPPQTFSGPFFWRNFRLEIVKQHKRTKKNRTNLDIKILRPSPQPEVLDVSAFGNGIKKKHSPTLEFEVNFVPCSIFEWECFQTFCVTLTTKVWKHFHSKNAHDTKLTSNSKVGECFF